MSHIVTVQMTHMMNRNTSKSRDDIVFEDIQVLKKVSNRLGYKYVELEGNTSEAVKEKALIYIKDSEHPLFIMKDYTVRYDDCHCVKDEIELLKQYYRLQMLKNHFGKAMHFIEKVKKNGDIQLMLNGESLMTIKKDGKIQYIYNEMYNLEGLGDITINRASYVEPESNGSSWYVDLSPLNKDKVTGFKTRSEALQFEVKYIEENVL